MILVCVCDANQLNSEELREKLCETLCLDSVKLRVPELLNFNYQIE